jgi:hypothetical protein
MPYGHITAGHRTRQYFGTRQGPTCHLPLRPRSLGEGGEVTLELAITPPLEAGTPQIDLVATGPSAQVQARLPLRWTWNP